MTVVPELHGTDLKVSQLLQERITGLDCFDAERWHLERPLQVSIPSAIAHKPTPEVVG